MHLTVDVPDDLFRALKRKAAKERTSIKAVVVRAVEKELQTPACRMSGKIVLPLIPSKQPGTLELDNERIYHIIDFP